MRVLFQGETHRTEKGQGLSAFSFTDSLPRCESMGDERLKREVKTTEGNGINIIQKQEETGNKQDSSELSPRHPATGLDNRVQVRTEYCYFIY